jgi:intracellular sulfur oxidation DsrE/DsrF family protein
MACNAPNSHEGVNHDQNEKPTVASAWNEKPTVLLLAFRGPAVTLVSTERDRFDLADFDALDQIADHIADLQMLGVRMEACGVACRLFQVDHNTLLDGIKPVGNTFVSLIGYQARGYAIIPIH